MTTPRTIAGTLKAIDRPIGEHDMKPGEVWFIKDLSVVLRNADGTPFYPNRGLFLAGEAQPAWCSPDNPSRQASRVVEGLFVWESKPVDRPTVFSLIYGLEIPSALLELRPGDVTSIAAVDCANVDAWGMEVNGSGETQTARRNYGPQFTACRDVRVANTITRRCQIGEDFVSCWGVVSEAHLSDGDGISATAGHGFGGSYTFSDMRGWAEGSNLPVIAVGATGLPNLPVQLVTDGTALVQARV